MDIYSKEYKVAMGHRTEISPANTMLIPSIFKAKDTFSENCSSTSSPGRLNKSRRTRAEVSRTTASI